MRQEIKYMLLAGAVVISLLFLVLGGQIYPRLYFGPEDLEGIQDVFREDLRSRGWTLHLSMLIVGLPWVMAGLFYYIINSVHFDRWWNWLIVLGVSTLLTAWCSIKMLSGYMEEFQVGLSDYYRPLTETLAGWVALFSAIIFIVASYGLRWWSSNCRHTPIPQ
ncbi:MAG: hypothetical protein K2M14_05300 [Muribaculaceae bacterium]|nr:hypothetical protein [Muribaculaceae bacterium]